MNVRTGELALDVAFTQFDGPAPVALVCGYNGAALPPKARADGWGRPVLLGFESSTTRSYSGGSGGPADATFSCDVFDAWGYGIELGSWCCAADSPNTDPVYLPNCQEYGRTYAATMAARGRLGPILWYGNPAAVEACAAGCRAAGVPALRWGVGTWGYGEGGGAGQPPASADVELLQSGNTSSPVGSTDLDWLYANVAVFAAYHGPSAPTPKDDDMLRMIQDSRGIYAWQDLDFVTLSPDEVPAFQFLTGGPPTPMSDANVDILMNVSRRLQQEGASSGGGTAGGVTLDEIRAAIVDALDHVKLTVG